MLRVFSSGSAWERAFQEAIRFLDTVPDGALLLGPAIGDSGKAWIQNQYLRETNVRFGARIQPWDEWVKGRARSHVLGQGKAFRLLNDASEREHFRDVGKILAASEAFHHLKDIWSEEKFFASLLDCVREARAAGLNEKSALERAKALLAEGADPVTRDAYEDFWNLLELYERRLTAGEDERFDESSLLRLAAESEGGLPPLFLLGFDSFTLLEVELLQKLATVSDLSIPFALSESTMAALVKGKDTELDHPAALALRGLLTGFSGKLEFAAGEASPPPPRRRLLAAHAPSEEARAAAALARAGIERFSELRFVAPPGYFEDGAVHGAFREELGLPRNFQPRRALSHPVARLFFHALALKDESYSLAYGLEYAQLLEFTRGRFGAIPSRAARAGVRKGLADWKKKAAGDRELQEFAAELERLDRLLPEEGSAEEFARAAEAVAELAGIGELARRAPDLEAQRDAHAALAGVLRNAQMLAASTKERFSFGDWMRELKNLLSGSLVGEVVGLFPNAQFYRYGEWLPPGDSASLTIALGLGKDAGPRRGFQFYFEERARRKLGDFLLPTGVQQDLAFLDQLKRLASLPGEFLFSWPAHDSSGKELEQSWACGSLDLAPGKWPEVAALKEKTEFKASAAVSIPGFTLGEFSPTLLETYKECPFKAFALNLLRLEDKVQESSLDVSRLDEGSLAHKALELYYGTRDGKNILDVAEREKALSECLEDAAKKQRIEYFKGSEGLFRAQLDRLKRKLLEFLVLDAENYGQFPHFSAPAVERVVGGDLGPYRWRGKIDRIDLDEQAKKLVVVDYKIGGTTPSNKDISELRKFQLQLYQDGAEAEFPGFEAVGGVYASLETGKRDQGLIRKDFNQGGKKDTPGPKYFAVGSRSTALKEPEDFRALREAARSEALRIAEQVNSGSFPVEPAEEEKSCSRCDVRHACRIRELRAPPREEWNRLAPEELTALLGPAPPAEEEKNKKSEFNPEQRDALDRRGSLVFIEASAGTGKTTVIVERVKRFLLERMEKEPAHLAVERFSAISFTEKSAQELGNRVARSLLQEEKLGARVAAQAQQQIGTIHGFCRRILSDFPIEAGISPLAAMLDEKGADALRASTIEEFFLFPAEADRPRFELCFRHFTRARVEELLVKLLSSRALFEREIALFRSGGEGLFPEGEAKITLAALLDLADSLQAAYEAAKRERSVLDFNDLESLALKVLQSEEARAYYRERFELLLVDEFQDTNSVQRAIFEAVARPGWSNVFVVGDAKQSIYRFRAADVSVFQGLRAEAEKNKALVTLSSNYRSAEEIVTAANSVTAAIFAAAGEQAPAYEAIDAPAIAEAGKGGRAAIVEYSEGEEKISAADRRKLEAELVAKLVREAQARPGKPRSIAVLLRKFAGNEAYLRALTRAGVSFRVGASRGFYGQSVVTDGIALLRVLYGAKNDIALLSVLRSPFVAMPDAKILELERRGEKYDALWDKLKPEEAPDLFEWKRRASHSSLAGILELAYSSYPMGRREHLQAVKLLRIVEGLESEARPRMEVLASLSSWSGWEDDQEGSDDAIMPEPGDAGTVQVMTVHAAKGLEFDVTILADLVGVKKTDNSPLRMVRGEGLVLKLKDEDSEAYSEIGARDFARELAELKRLFYVAITRAKQELYMLLPKERKALPKEKWVCCADFLRAADPKVERVDAETLFLPPPSSSVKNSTVPIWPKIPAYSLFRDTSISEIAAFQFCGEFHRRKFVQGWDDRIVALWPEPGKFKKFSNNKAPKDPERERVGKLLKALKIEKKERGIALHRVLERVQDFDRDVPHVEIWLLEAYEAQGVDPESAKLKELIALDSSLLLKFLSSPLGRDLFSAEAQAFPEIPFEWRLGEVRLHGAMDRLIRRADGTWVVVDYKSSILEESLERYRFQVSFYMAAVAAHAPGSKVEGFLVDLFEARSYPVEGDAAGSRQAVLAEVRSAAGNYTLTDPSELMKRISGGDHCFHCPYSMHCDVGREIVLASK